MPDRIYRGIPSKITAVSGNDVDFIVPRQSATQTFSVDWDNPDEMTSDPTPSILNRVDDEGLLYLLEEYADHIGVVWYANDAKHPPTSSLSIDDSDESEAQRRFRENF